MGLVAVIFSILTVLFGTVALGEVATPASTGGVRALVAGHLLLALCGFVLLLVAVVGASQGVAWGSFVVLVGAAVLGVSTLLRSSRTRGGGDGADPAPDAEAGSASSVAVPVIVLHGAAALITITLVWLTAIGVAQH
jgi:hypothetical protein